MIFDIVIPTYKRPEKLAVCLKSIMKNHKKNNIRIFVYFDNNDNGYISGVNQVYIARLKKQYRAFGIWNLHLKHLRADGMIYICDDIELWDDCLEKALDCFKTSFPDSDGFLGLNQENLDYRGSDTAMGLIGKRFTERFPERQCFCPDYVSFHADMELGIFAKSLKKFIFCEDAKLTHFHPGVFKKGADEAHKEVRIPNIVQQDKATRKKRRELNLVWGESFRLVQ